MTHPTEWTEATLRTYVQECEQSEYLYATMAKAARVAGAVLGLMILAGLGMESPRYFIVTLAVLMLAYHPYMSLTTHQFNVWADRAAEEAAKYRAVIDKLDDDGVIQAQIRALKASKPTAGDDIWCALKASCIEVEIAYLGVAHNGDRLADYGTFNDIHDQDLMGVDIHEIVVFTLTNGTEIKLSETPNLVLGQG